MTILLVRQNPLNFRYFCEIVSYSVRNINKISPTKLACCSAHVLYTSLNLNRSVYTESQISQKHDYVQTKLGEGS